MDEGAQGRALSDSTIANCVKPLRAMFATAVSERLLRFNPCDGVHLPKRAKVDDGDEDEGPDARALTREQAGMLVECIHPRHRLMIRFLLATGLRLSELRALRWRDFEPDGGGPYVRVRRQFYRGELSPLKTKKAKREVSLSRGMATALRERRAESEWSGDDDLVFANLVGKPLSPSNFRRDFLRPAMAEIGAEWASFHSLRHTCASIFERGCNALEVSEWLGHSNPSFTIDTYIHLIRKERTEGVDLEDELRVPVDEPDTVPAELVEESV